MVDETLFDLECLRKGLPPMSGSSKEIFKMIVSSPPAQKRAINRKIRKLAKSAIRNRQGNDKRRCQHLFMSINTRNTGKRTTTRHILNRIRLARSYLKYKFQIETCLSLEQSYT